MARRLGIGAVLRGRVDVGGGSAGVYRRRRGSGGASVVIPAGIAAGDLGRARSSVAPRKGTSCHVGPGGQAVRVRGRRRGVRADARALAGRPTGRDWAKRGSGVAGRRAGWQGRSGRGKKKRAGLGHEESGPGERVGLVSWVFPNGLVWVSRFGFWVSLTFSISIPKQTKFEFKQI